jgi:hypothetical protein
VNSLTNESEAFPIKVDAIIICPVDETGRNSVSPSIMAKIMASIKVMNADAEPIQVLNSFYWVS